MQPATESTSETESTTTSIKRKADEAFDALDDALRPTTDRPSLPKRINNSLYGSLAKYGVFNKPPPRFKTTLTPTLTTLLSRSRAKKVVKLPPVSQHTTAPSATLNYSPGSTDALLQRLSTFTFQTYTSKPSQIDAVAASKAGWINEGGKDRLYCAICRVGWVIAGREGLNKDAANALVEKQRQSLVDMHKEGCPWRVRQCDPLVYRIPLQSPTKLAKEIKACAEDLEPLVGDIAIQHPLSFNQVIIFAQTIYSVPSHTSASPPSSPPLIEDTTKLQSTPLYPTALLISLFGWSLVPPPPLLSRKSSSASLVLAHSHALSVQNRADSSRAGTAILGESNNPVSQHSPANGPISPFGTPRSSRKLLQQKDTMLHCRMCQRRIGLWAFAAPSADSEPTNRRQRRLDLLREHRSYCPYVVKSTPLASLPSYPPLTSISAPRSSFIRTGSPSSISEPESSPSGFNLRRTASLLSGASSLALMNPLSFPTKSASSELQDYNLVEGWRAVYNTVLRFEMSERVRVKACDSGSSVAPLGIEPVGGHGEKAEDDAMKGVLELVEGVKKHGGKQLLSYVRSLLG